jgi:hypothetical protein
VTTVSDQLDLRWVWGSALAALLVALLLGVANLFYGELNQDEGWYLYAARQVAEGQRPYADFAFTQGPVFARVYALADPLVAATGLMGGRLFTAGLGLLAAGFAAWLAARLAPAGWRGWTSAVTLVVLLCNVYHSYYSLVVKTYSLTALLLAAGGCCLTLIARRRGVFWAAGAGLLLALAAGVRLSAGVWLPVVGLYLLWTRSRWPLAWLGFGVGGVLGLALAFGAAFWQAPEATWFWLVEYHTARAAGSGLQALVFKGGFVSRFVQAYSVLCLGVLLLGLAVWVGRQRLRDLFPGVAGALGVACLALTGVHLSAPFPYEDYQVVLVPVASAVLAAGGARLLASRLGATSAWARAVLVGMLVSSTAAAFSSPLNQQWVVQERDRIWWRLKDQPDLVRLQETGRWLAEQMGEGEVLLTQDTYLAVEAGAAVPAGLEMGPFSYVPDWSDELAAERHVVNRAMLLELLATSEARWVALSGYGFSISSPDVVEVSAEDQQAFRALIEARYVLRKTVPHFGQAGTTLYLYEAKDGS